MRLARLRRKEMTTMIPRIERERRPREPREPEQPSSQLDVRFCFVLRSVDGRVEDGWPMLREDISCPADRRQPSSYHVCFSIRNSSCFRDDYGIAMEADCPSEDMTQKEWQPGTVRTFGLSVFIPRLLD
jgi:hypothetical protein